jgi:hypothetical protein
VSLIFLVNEDALEISSNGRQWSSMVAYGRPKYANGRQWSSKMRQWSSQVVSENSSMLYAVSYKLF